VNSEGEGRESLFKIRGLPSELGVAPLAVTLFEQIIEREINNAE